MKTPESTPQLSVEAAPGLGVWFWLGCWVLFVHGDSLFAWDFLFVGLVFVCVFCCGFCCWFLVVWLGSVFHFSDIHQVSSQHSLHYRHEHSACQMASAVTKVMTCVSSNQKESKEVATDPLWKHRRYCFFLI